MYLQFFWSVLFFVWSLEKTHGGSDMGILRGVGSVEKIRRLDIHLEEIPAVILGMIEFIMEFIVAFTIVVLIIGAYQMIFGTVADERSRGKTTIYLALSGFVLASLSWVILKIVADNFS